MLSVLAILCVVINTGAGLALAVTRGGVPRTVGLAAARAVLCRSDRGVPGGFRVGFIPAVLSPQQQRSYLWVFGVGVKLVAASLFARLWFAGLAGWLPGVVALADGALAALILVALLKPAR